MKIKTFAALLLSASLFYLGSIAFADPVVRNQSQAQSLISILPASDGVLTVDIKRVFGDALPRILAAKPAMLADVTKKIDELQTASGIDIRQFESLAAGVNLEATAPGKYNVDPVIAARGQINAAGLVGAAKLASNGKYREEQVGTRTVYIFSAKNAASQAKPAAAAAGVADKISGTFSDEVAVTAFDANTVVLGSLARVRETLNAKTHVGTDITGLLTRGQSAVANFALKTPTGLSAFMPLENDELGKSLGSIRYLFGSMDIAADAAVLDLNARTLQNAQAQSLYETLQGLQIIGKGALGGSKTPEKQVYARMIENAKITAAGNEVSLNLRVPQSDIDILVGSLK